MSTWIEIRCEDRAESFADGHINDRCWSWDNMGCGEMALDNVKSILATKKLIENGAKKAGWVKYPRGWVCPHCIEQRKLNQQPAGQE